MSHFNLKNIAISSLIALSTCFTVVGQAQAAPQSNTPHLTQKQKNAIAVKQKAQAQAALKAKQKAKAHPALKAKQITKQKAANHMNKVKLKAANHSNIVRRKDITFREEKRHG